MQRQHLLPRWRLGVGGELGGRVRLTLTPWLKPDGDLTLAEFEFFLASAQFLVLSSVLDRPSTRVTTLSQPVHNGTAVLSV